MKYVLRNCTVEAKKLEYTTDSQKEIVDWVNAVATQDSESSLIHACAGHDGGVVIKYPDRDRVVANTGAYVVHDDCGISVWEGKHFEDTYMQHAACRMKHPRTEPQHEPLYARRTRTRTNTR